MTVADLDTAALKSLVQGLYSDEQIDTLIAQTKELIAEFAKDAAIPATTQPLTASSTALVTYANSVTEDGATPLQSLKNFIAENRLGEVLPLVHLLPFYPWDTDRGFSVIDYRQVNPDYGSWDDVTSLGEDVDLMFDFVANHASVENPILQAALIERHLDPQDKRYEHYKQYKEFVTAFSEDDRPSDDELAQLSRPRPNPVLAPYVVEEVTGELRAFLGQPEETSGTVLGSGYVWATFSRAPRDDGTEDTRQIDLNFANPAVLLETLRILLFYVQQSADVVRLDAIGYIWKKLGSTSLHEPEAHRLLAFIDLVLKSACPHVRTIAEVNEPQDKVFTYLGSKDQRESDLVYQFTHFPLAIHALHRETGQHYRDWLPTTNKFEGRQFITVTGSHDGLGLKPVRGILPEDELEWLSDQLITEHGALPNYAKLPGGEEIIYEICATPWHLITDPNKAEDMRLQVDRYMAIISLGLIPRGIPAFYINGVIGAPNYLPPDGLDENRTINREVFVRPKLQHLLTNPGHQQQVLQRLRDLLTIRGQHAAFSPDGAPLEIIDAQRDAVVAAKLVSADGADTVIALTNVSSTQQTATITLDNTPLRDILHDGEEIDPSNLTLGAYQSRWLVTS